MTSDQIIAAAVALGVPASAVEIFKPDYRCATPDWIQHAFAAAMTDFWTGRNQILGSEDAFNCVDYASTTAAIAKLDWTKTDDPDAHTVALAVGDAGFPTIAHDLFIAAHYDKDNVPFLQCYESVPRQDTVAGPVRILYVVTLDPQDWKQCDHIIFR